MLGLKTIRRTYLFSSRSTAAMLSSSYNKSKKEKEESLMTINLQFSEKKRNKEERWMIKEEEKQKTSFSFDGYERIGNFYENVI